jgi:hypothetical protein
MTHRKEITEHGMSMYRQRKCRCDICKQAAADQRKQFRKPDHIPTVRLDGHTLLERLEADGRLLAVHTSIRDKWRRFGIAIHSADFWCIKLGYHPVEIWGNDFYQDLPQDELVDA